MAETYRVGLLGHGTVGAAFEQLLQRARGRDRARDRAHGPRSAACSRARRGDFDEILASTRPDRRADRRHRAGARVRAAGDAGRQARRVAPTSCCSPRTARSCGRRPASTRSSCASRAPWRASCRSSACCRSRSRRRTWSASTGSSTARRTSSSPRWRAAARRYGAALQRAQELGYAEADPTDDVTGRDAAAKMAILARLAFSTPVHLDQVTYEGIEHITAEDVAYARDLGLGLKLIGTAERVDGGISVRVHPAFLYPGHPLASVHGSFNAVTIESDAITEITLSGPGAGGPQTATRGARRRDQRDDPARLHAGDERAAAESSPTSSPPSTSRWRSTTSPACSPRSPRCSGCRARRSSPWSRRASAARRGS